MPKDVCSGTRRAGRTLGIWGDFAKQIYPHARGALNSCRRNAAASANRSRRSRHTMPANSSTRCSSVGPCGECSAARAVTRAWYSSASSQGSKLSPIRYECLSNDSITRANRGPKIALSRKFLTSCFASGVSITFSPPSVTPLMR
jgi:hypothetical protein